MRSKREEGRKKTQTGVAITLGRLLVKTVEGEKVAVVGLLVEALDLIRCLPELCLHC